MATETIPHFPVPEFDGPTTVFGAPRSAYISEDAMPREFYRGHHPMCEVASKLFFHGGKLADFGLRWKPEIDATKAMRALRGLLGSFDPSHEIKIGTVGIALAQWCETYTPEPVAAEPAKKAHARENRKSHKIRRAM